jgi:hypothetical protein
MATPEPPIKDWTRRAELEELQAQGRRLSPWDRAFLQQSVWETIPRDAIRWDAPTPQQQTAMAAEQTAARIKAATEAKRRAEAEAARRAAEEKRRGEEAVAALLRYADQLCREEQERRRAEEAEREHWEYIEAKSMLLFNAWKRKQMDDLLTSNGWKLPPTEEEEMDYEDE